MKIRKLRPLLLTVMSLMTVTGVSAYNFLFIGDSITDGNWGNPKGWPCPSENRNSADRNHVYGHGYAEMSIGRLASQNPDTTVRYYNRGISGNTLPQMAERWEKDAMSLNPDLISILIGTNDVQAALKRGETIDYTAWEATLDSLLTLSRERNPQVRLMLGTPFTARVGKVGASPAYEDGLEMTHRLAEVIRRVAARHGATLVPFDVLVEKLTSDTSAVPPSYWIWDGIHPTTPCHTLMSDLWLEKYAAESE